MDDYTVKMMKIQKKHIIAGAIGLVTITGAVLYLQYKKLMDYVISFKSVKVKAISAKEINFDLFLNFENKSNLKFTIEKQKYDIFINNIFLQTLQNDAPNTIMPNSTSVIGMNIKFDPNVALQRLKLTAATLLGGTDKIMVKIVTKMTVKYGIIKFTIPSYTYEDTLKNLMA